MAPGLGDQWFGDDYRPEGWLESEKWKFLLTELIPLTFFIGMGVLFWAVGRRNLAKNK
jgi:hypothetical protein